MTMELRITTEVVQRGRWFVARCPELDFVSQGASPEEAKRNLSEAIEIQLEEMAAMDSLDDYLAECGYSSEADLKGPTVDLRVGEHGGVAVWG